MRKPVKIVMLLVAAVVVVFYIWSAKVARRKSDQILEQFKSVDKGLDQASDSISFRWDTGK